MKLATSILNLKDPKKEQFQLLEQTTTDFFHLDIMDGKFVKQQAGDLEELKNLLLGNRHPLDIHFMVENIPTYVAAYQILKPKFMTFHYEATTEVEAMIALIRTYCKVGLSIKPSTPVSAILPYLPLVDLVLVMSVEPGLGGQTFLSSTSSKLNFLKSYRDQNKLKYLIEVDGGINADTVQYVKDADLLVVGTYITHAEDYQEAINQLKNKEV